MSPARRSIGATCWGCPRRRHLAVLKCSRGSSRRRRSAIRPWARAHIRRFPSPEWTSGRSSPVRRPTGRVLPVRKDLRPVKPILRGGRRSDRSPPASSMMARTAPTPTPCRGTGHGGDHWTQRRHRACRRWRSQASPRGTCSRFSSGAAEPQTFMCPLLQAGATVQPRPLRRPEE
jgi:hypothetical protein